jgi:hypothetical protein
LQSALRYAAHYHFIARKPVGEFRPALHRLALSWFGGVWVLSALGDVVGGFDCSASGLA